MMKRPIKIQNLWIKLLIQLCTIVLAALLLSVYFFRFDLTSEKRYTLSDFSKTTLRGLDDVVQIKVFLEGDLNIPFRKMQKNLKETLDEFGVYAGNHLEVSFINPFKGKNEAAVDSLISDLYSKGLRPTNIMASDKEGGTSEKLVLPGALIAFKGTEVPLNLLKNNPGVPAEENINNSMQAFEFELMRVISSLTADSLEKVAFLEGQGEFNEYETGDLTRELGWYFQVDRGMINGKPGVLDNYKAVIVAGPTRAFTEQDKFVLDQYLMNGGRVLWFVDMVSASLDSISEGRSMLALIRSLNIEDLLFRYGARLNPILLQDIQCNVIPVNVALAGSSPDFKPAPWLYSPLLASPYNHPITRNLNMIMSEFSGDIDTIAARSEIKKTVLLRTSEFSRQVSIPAMISLDEVRFTPKQEQFSSKYLPVAVLLEGQFETAFKNRMLSEIFPDTTVQLIEKGRPSKVMVVADADIIRNEVRATPQGVLISPLGYDRYTNQTFGNKEFIVNAIQYMTGHESVVNLRAREITLRLLDKSKIKNDRTKWVLVNTLGPPLIIILAGILYAWIRKKSFAGYQNSRSDQ